MSTATLDVRPKVKTSSIGISSGDQRKISDELAGVLGDTYALLVKTHVYHWNVVGPLFYGLHKLLEEQYTDLFAATDEIAERIRALGVPTPVGFDELIGKSALKEETSNRTAGGMVEQLVMDHEKICKRMREAAGKAEEADDLVTADLLTQRLAFHEKAIWMLRAIITQ